MTQPARKSGPLVNEIFAQNLRKLCTQRGTLAAVARDLGFTKVQMQRYLRGTSFPKPDVLQQICRYFATDARILTTPVAQFSPQLSSSDRDRDDTWAVGLVEALRYAAPDVDYFAPSTDLPDGLYTTWRRSFLAPDFCYRSVVLVKTLNHGRVLRGYEARNSPIATAREYRGVIYQQAQGHIVQFFYNDPVRALAQAFLSPIILGAGRPSLQGYMALGREEFFGLSRISRMLWEPIAPNFAAAMASYRRLGMVKNADVPVHVANLIMMPLA